jgi:hypothetical protein
VDRTGRWLLRHRHDFGAYQLSVNPAAVVAESGGTTDLGDATGASMSTGRVDGSAPAVDHQCTSGVESNSVTLRWTAPSSGTFTFSTLGSDFDTVLSVIDSAGCTELVCSDDVQVGTESTSEVELDVTGGEGYLIAISGYGSETGSYVLNIR